MTKTILRFTGLAAIAALFCAGCDSGDGEPNGDADRFLNWMNGASYKFVAASTDMNHGTVEVSPDRNSYKIGEQVTVTAVPKNGYRLIGWSSALAPSSNYVSSISSGDTTYTNPLTITITGNDTLIADFALRKWSLTVLVSPSYGGGNVNIDKKSDNNTYTHGDTVTLTAVSAANYILTGWYDSSNKLISEDTSLSMRMERNMTLTARFALGYTVTFDANGAEGETPPLKQVPNSSISLPDGDGMTRKGYEFTGWSERTGGTETTYKAGDGYQVTENITLYAQWIAASLPNAVEMTPVTGGRFTKGIGNDIVTVGNFSISTHEVTQQLWRDVMGYNPSEFKGDTLPVESISWNEVQEFITALNKKDPGKGYRLPTEEEWEYAARGGKNSDGYNFSGSNTVGDVAWYKENSDNKTHNVGEKDENELGIYDMSGNVREWVEDETDIDPDAPDARVIRGGGWDDRAANCTVLSSTYGRQGYRDKDLGFRLVRDP